MGEARGEARGVPRGVLGSSAKRLLLWVGVPIWVGPFLLLQALRLCSDGLLQFSEESLGRRFALGRFGWVLLGIPGLVLFPLLVGMRGVLLLASGLGRWVLPRRWGTRPGRGYGALRLLVGFLGGLLLPLWLPLVLLVWLGRWVIGRILLPEFARGLSGGGQRGDERLVTFVGLRYLFSRRESALHSATSYFAAGGIALGVCALIVVLAVMTGFDSEVRSRIVGTNAHVLVLRFGQQGIAGADSLAAVLAGHPEAAAVAPFVYGKAMLSAGRLAEGAVVKGIRWEEEARVTSLPEYVGERRRDPGLARVAGGLPGIVLGKYVAEGLGIGVGEEVVLVSPAETRRTPLGFVPRMRRFRLCGIFQSGMYDFDASMAYIDLAEAQAFFGLEERVSGIEVRLHDMDRAPQVAEEMTAELGGFPYYANNWIELNENLFAWMRTEKRAMFIILIMIILVAGFNIASSLVMLVTEKRREIGILKSMGASALAILRIFVLEGWVMAFAGTALGVGAGLGICHIIERYEIIRLPGDIYFIDTLPVEVVWGDIWLIVVSVLVIAALSTLYPAWRAAQLDPVEAIRDE
ncbi:MAG: ABC transporter permease [Candidatus Eisenbacteria sp.]|nr:ABC transporter permease [Candidatus Eisenbacteria bacterium]